MSIIPYNLVSIVSKVSPVLGSALAGPAGGIVGSLISSVIGADMKDQNDVAKKLDDPDCVAKLKELELQFSDLADARNKFNSYPTSIKVIYLLLTLFAMLSLAADIYLLDFVENPVSQGVLLVVLYFIVNDLRQIYKFFFGSGEDLPLSMFIGKKK